MAQQIIGIGTNPNDGTGDTVRDGGKKINDNFTELYGLVQQAWTAYTPTIAPSSGAFTAASATGKYAKIGKTVFFSISITITTNGTGAGNVNASLPLTPAVNANAFGRENSIGGKMLQGLINSGTATVFIYNYDNTYPGGNGANIRVSGFYEVA